MIFSEGVLEQFQGIRDGRLQPAPAFHRRGEAHKIPHLRHHGFQAAHFLGNDVQFLPGLVVQAGSLKELPGEATDDQQGVFDLMGDMGHGIAHRGQAFGLEQPVFHS